MVSAEAQTPKIYWQFDDWQWINGDTQFQFDVQVRTDQQGTWMNQMLVCFNYNPDYFGYNIVDNNNVFIELTGIMDDPGVVGNPFYPLYGTYGESDHTSSQYIIFAETLYPNKLGGEVFTFLGTDYPYNLEMPVTYVNFLRFVINVQNTQATLQVSFEPSEMNGNQFYLEYMYAMSLPYDNPGIYENDISFSYANYWIGAADSNWNNPANWSGGQIPNGEEVGIQDVSPWPFPVISDPGAVTGELNIYSGAKLEITDMGNLTATGPINNNGELIIHSFGNDTAAWAGSLIDNGEYTGGGSYVFKRWLTSCIGNDPFGEAWNYISSPLPGALSGLFDDCYIKFWEEPQSLYYDLDPNGTGTEPLEVSKGYAVEYASATPEFKLVDFTGSSFNTGNQLIFVTAEGPPLPNPPANNGWNLIGNPYPSGLDWNSVMLPVNVEPTVYYWDEEDLIYKTYTQNVGGSGSTFIPPTQGFFVHATANDVFSFTNDARVHDGQGLFYKSYQDNLVILAAGNDEAWILMDNAATSGFDPMFDAYKMFSYSDVEQIYSKPGNIALATNTVPYMPSVPVGFFASAGTYTITASHIGSDFSDLFLFDLETGVLHDLIDNNSYAFTTEEGEDPDRFILYFTPIGMTEDQNAEIKIFPLNKKVIIRLNKEMEGIISVCNLSGQQVAIERFSPGEKTIEIPCQSGLSVVQVLSGKDTFTQKVMIR